MDQIWILFIILILEEVLRLTYCVTHYNVMFIIFIFHFIYLRGHSGTVRSTVASQQEGRGFKSRIVQHVGACSRAFLCGVCMFSPCSPGFPP